MTTSDVGLAAPVPPGPRVLNPRLEWARVLLPHISPYGGTEQRTAVLKAVHHTTGGSDAGLAMAEEWCREVSSYPGKERFAVMWRSIPREPPEADGFGQLCVIAGEYGFDWQELCGETEPGFQPSYYEAVDAEVPSAGSEPAEDLTALDKYSLTTRRHEVERTAVEQDFVMGRLALRGQLSAYFGPPNIGKTAIAMALLGRAAQERMIDARKCYYLDFDTDANGLLAKIDYAIATGIKVLSDGYLGFSSQRFLEEMEQMIASGQALGSVVILDTIKQHVSIMQKDESAEFAKRLRRFSKAGGSCLVMAHVNKARGLDGRPVHAGTTDLVELFDACYLVYEVETDAASQSRTVLFESFKARGPVARRETYRYSTAEGLTYRELLDSVERVDGVETAEMAAARQLRADSELIQAVEDAIRSGTVAKMELIGAAVERSGVSKRAVLAVLERYTGVDATVYRWMFTVHARGEKRYALLNDGGRSG